MPRFRYVAMDPKGSETEGVLDAENQTQAVNMIRAKGFFPTRVTELDAGKAVARAEVQGGGKKGLNMEIRLPSFLGGRCKPKQLLRGLKILLKQEK